MLRRISNAATAMAGSTLAFAMVFSPAARAEIDWGNALIQTFEQLGSDTRNIRRKVRGYSAKSWYRSSIGDVTAVGAGACAVPVGAYAALPAEFVYLMREIYNSSLGLGFLKTGSAHRDDFASILAKWGGDYNISDSELARLMDSAEYEAITEILQEAAGEVPEQLWRHRAELARRLGINPTPVPAYSGATGTAKSGEIAGKGYTKGGAKVASKGSTKVSAKVASKGRHEKLVQN